MLSSTPWRSVFGAGWICADPGDYDREHCVDLVQLSAFLREIAGLGHAWSGGKASLLFSDPAGPDATRMVWAFAAAQFKLEAPSLISAANT